MENRMNTAMKALDQSETRLTAEDRARNALANLKSRIDETGESLKKQPDSFIELKIAFLGAFDHIVSSSAEDLGCERKFNEFSLWNIVKLVDELSVFPEFDGCVDELWDIVAQGTIQEIEKQNPGSWMEECDSLMSAFSVVRNLAEAGGKNPRLHQKTLELIGNPIFYGIQETSDSKSAPFFASQKNSASTGALVRKGFSQIFGFAAKRPEPKWEGRLSPTREELGNRRIDALFIAATWFARSGNRKGAFELFKECFRILSVCGSNRWEIFFYQKLNEVQDILAPDPELFEMFESEFRKFRDPEWRSSALLSLAEIHFQAFKDPKRAAELLKDLGGIEFLSLTSLVASIRDFVASANPVIDSEGEAILRELTEVLEKSFEYSKNAEGMLEISGVLKEKWNPKLAKKIAARVMGRVETMKSASHRFGTLLRFSEMENDTAMTERLVSEMEEFVDERLGTFHRNGYETFDTAKILAKHYAAGGNLGAIDSLVLRTNEKEEFPEDYVTKILEGAMIGFVESGDYDSAFECVEKTPPSSQGTNLNRMVRLLSAAGKFKEALEFAGKRNRFRDANVIADDSSDLIAKIMLDANGQGASTVTKRCLDLLLLHPMNEYVLRDIVNVYRTNREIFDSGYFLKLFPHATKSYKSWVSTSHFKAVLETFREIDAADLFPPSPVAHVVEQTKILVRTAS